VFYGLAGKSVGQAEGSACLPAVNLRFAGFTTLSGGRCLPTVARPLCHFVTSPHTVGSHPRSPPAKGKYIPFGIPILAAAPHIYKIIKEKRLCYLIFSLKLPLRDL